MLVTGARLGDLEPSSARSSSSAALTRREVEEMTAGARRSGRYGAEPIGSFVKPHLRTVDARPCRSVPGCMVGSSPPATGRPASPRTERQSSTPSGYRCRAPSRRSVSESLAPALWVSWSWSGEPGGSVRSCSDCYAANAATSVLSRPSARHGSTRSHSRPVPCGDGVASVVYSSMPRSCCG